MRRWVMVPFVVGLFMVCSGMSCSIDVDGQGTPTGTHSCADGAEYNETWGSYGLELHHQEPRDCPVSLRDLEGNYLETMGVVFDQVPYDAQDLEVGAYNSDGRFQGGSKDWFHGGYMEPREADYWFSYMPATGTWYGGPSPDQMVVEVEEHPEVAPHPYASFYITYTD